MRTCIATAFALFVGAAAFGQNLHSFVSVYGSDANNCTALFQCRSFFRAMNVTNPGGEVIATTSGGYVSFIVQKAITISAAPGAYVSIFDFIGVVAGPTDRVVLRGLHVEATNRQGIYAAAYGSLFIEDCDVTGGTSAIRIDGSTTPAVLTNVVARDFTESGFIAVPREGTSASVCSSCKVSRIVSSPRPTSLELRIKSVQLRWLPGPGAPFS